jgi:type I restriction enzyme, S subunit
MRHIELGQIITPAKPRRAGEINYPILSMTMRDGLVNQADKFKKRIASADTSQYKVVGKNQLVVGFPIDEGVLAFQNLYDEAIVSPAYNIWNLQNDALIDSKYLEQFLRSPRALAFYKSKLRSTTARRRSLPNDVFLSLSVPVPSLAEQVRIMKLLDEADELRKLRAQADRRTAALIPALFYEMFAKAKFTEKTIGEYLEEGWLLLHKDGNHGSLYPRASDFGDEGIPFLSATCVTDEGAIEHSEVKRLSEEKSKQLRHGWLERDDVLLAHNATVGKVGYYEGEYDRALIGTSLTAFRVNPVHIDSHFLWAALRDEFFQRQLERIMKQALRNQVPITAQRELLLRIPSLPLQKKFAQRVSEFRELEAAQAASRQHVEHLFQSMLHRAFNQEL